MSVSEVRVRVGYRLHLGFYRYLDEGLAYGAIGLSVEEPYLEVRATKTAESSGISISAPTEESSEAVKRVVKYLAVAPANLVITGYVRHHVGLGSITRLCLATAVTLSMLHRRADLNLEELLVRLGRCKYSCVGYYTFLYGGLAVDTGVPLGQVGTIPKPLALVKFPRSWYVVIAIPEGGGLREEEEEPHLRSPTPVDEQGDLYRALVYVLSGVKLERLDLFTRGVETIQRVAGNYFSKVQGGVFSSEYGEEIARAMLESGLRGIGQSSWGPTIYGFTDSYSVAESARRNVLKLLDRLGVGCDVWVSRGAELGYSVQVLHAR